MGTQKKIAEKIVDKEADYILQVKGNQETLLEDISMYFKEELFQRSKKELEKEGRYWKEISFDHGRMEIREYYVENDVEWLRKNHPGWKGLKGEGHGDHNGKK